MKEGFVYKKIEPEMLKLLWMKNPRVRENRFSVMRVQLLHKLTNESQGDPDYFQLSKVIRAFLQTSRFANEIYLCFQPVSWQ